MDPHLVPWWLGYTFDTPLRRVLHNPTEILGRHIKEGWTVVDLGCGMGYFSIPLARMVGEKGRVISVDVQPPMLKVLRKRAERTGVLSRIQTVHCGKSSIGFTESVDFALAFAMAHEVEDLDSFFREVRAILKPEARLLLAEPRFHVPSFRFRQIVEKARAQGLIPDSEPTIKICRAVLLKSS